MFGNYQVEDDAMQGVYFVIGYEKEPSPLSVALCVARGGASTQFLCISYAKRVFDISEWGGRREEKEIDDGGSRS